MIRKERGHIVTTCDRCGMFRIDQEGRTPTFRNYRQAWDDALKLGWTAKKMPKDYQHFCPECTATPSMAVKPTQNG